MKLYSYSSEYLTFAKTKWVKAKCTAAGILLGVIIFFGFIMLNKTIGNVFEPRVVKALTAENDFLRQHVSLMSPRISRLETQTRLLIAQEKTLHQLLYPAEVAVDTVPRYTFLIERLKLQSQIVSAVNFQP